jgi:TonB family protein
MLVFSAISALAQSKPASSTSDTAYFKFENGFIVRCGASKAEGYSVAIPNNANVYLYKISYLHTDTKMAEYEVYDKKYSRGNVTSYIPIKNGKYDEWYISGAKRVSCSYSEDKLNGDFTAYYPSGKLKRSEKWKGGECLYGECYDENGSKKEYCPYQELAEYVGGLYELYKFIGKTLQYPEYALKNGIEGVVYVSFIVDVDGAIIDAKIREGVEEHLNSEALRIVKSMPKWKPGRFEGKNVKVEFTLPVRFKLS